MQDVNGGPHPVVHPRRVGNQSYTLTFQASEILFFQYLDTGLYSDLLCLHRTSAKEAEQGYNNSPLHNQSLNITHKTLIINHFFPYSGSILLSAKMVTTTVAKQHIITNQKKSVYPIASWIYPANIPGIIMLSAMNAVQMA